MSNLFKNLDSFQDSVNRLYDAIKPIEFDIDPDDFAPNRAANSAERIVEILEKQEESNRRESIKTTIILVISGLTLIATLIGLFR